LLPSILHLETSCLGVVTPAGRGYQSRGVRYLGDTCRTPELGQSACRSRVGRAETTEPLTTAQIAALKQEQPEWLRRERSTRAEAQRAEARPQAEKTGTGRPAR